MHGEIASKHLLFQAECARVAAGGKSSLRKYGGCRHMAVQRLTALWPRCRVSIDLPLFDRFGSFDSGVASVKGSISLNMVPDALGEFLVNEAVVLPGWSQQ